jgi:hypothetical protein
VRHLGFELTARQILAIAVSEQIWPSKQKEKDLLVITKVPNVDDIVVNRVDAVLHGAPRELATRPEITPIPYIT